jgi:DME family drug/metabolite transporter
MSAAPRARLGVVGAALLFSTGGAAIKATALSSWQVASFRSGVAVLALVLFLPEARRGFTARAAAVAVAYAATLVLFVTANKLTTSASTIFLQSGTSPLYVLLLGPLLLREPVRRLDLVFMAMILSGMAMFFLGADAPARTAPDPVRGNALAALAGVTWALTVVGLRWMGSASAGGAAMAAVVIGNLFAFLACLPFALPLAEVRAADAAAVVYLGVFQVGLAYLLLTSAMRHVPALEASLLLLMEPALNPLWTWIAHGERPGAWTLAGGVLVIGTTAAKAWVDARAAAPAC